MKNRKRKTLQELTLKDNFMFGAVMLEEENCRQFLELLLSGEEYSSLPDSYVIFICDFDPFGEKKYRYTFETKCLESNAVKAEDGRTSIFLSTHGQNEQEESKELVSFLQYVKADLEESKRTYKDDFVRKLQQSVKRIKESREMGVRYMAWHEMLREEWNDGRLEGRKEGRLEAKIEDVLELLEDLGNIPEELRKKIKEEQDVQTIKSWLKLSARVESIEQFIEQM